MFYRAASGALVALALSACGPFADISSIPKAPPYLAEPEPSMITVAFDVQGDAPAVQDAVFHVYSMPGHAEATLLSYAVQYFDMNNQPISVLDQPKTALSEPRVVPASIPGHLSPLTLNLPVYNPKVITFGKSDPAPVITARVTLYGAIDRFEQIEIPFNVPIKFERPEPGTT